MVVELLIFHFCTTERIVLSVTNAVNVIKKKEQHPVIFSQNFTAIHKVDVTVKYGAKPSPYSYNP
jgi:hypothetical protein